MDILNLSKELKDYIVSDECNQSEFKKLFDYLNRIEENWKLLNIP
jgi:hypothetical protein